MATVDGALSDADLRRVRMVQIGAGARTAARAVANRQFSLPGTCNGVYVRAADLEAVRAVSGRLAVRARDDGLTVIDDTYNASTPSVISRISASGGSADERSASSTHEAMGRPAAALGAEYLAVTDHPENPPPVRHVAPDSPARPRGAAHAPGFRDLVLARHVLAPGDLERHDANLVAGDMAGGTNQLHQQLVFRPVPGLARPETPVRGLYLASSSAHPGGGVHGACGANAARAARARRRLGQIPLFGGWRPRPPAPGGPGVAQRPRARVRLHRRRRDRGVVGLDQGAGVHELQVKLSVPCRKMESQAPEKVPNMKTSEWAKLMSCRTQYTIV